MDIPPFGPATGHECSFPSALAAATRSDYAWLIGSSGAAFTTGVDAIGWDPLTATPRDAPTQVRTARAAGVRLDHLTPPFDDELRELVAARVIEAIGEKLPPLIEGPQGPPEYGLLVGFDTEARTFLARTFLESDPKPASVTWDALLASPGGVFFLDRAAPPARALLAREGIRAALDGAGASDAAALTWIAGLRDDARWTDPSHAGSAAFGDHAMRRIFVDKRRGAAQFLRTARSIFMSTPGVDLLRAAESYGFAADAVAKTGLGEFDATVAMRFLDRGQRRGLANALDTAVGHEREAREALAAAEKAIA
ncbi:MAG: hypothetical protein M3O91_05340 [Chloroflexota bacterium]|nr:hypothetical protein [Chloroflexota bacterium]